MVNDKEFMNIEQAAEYLGLSVKTLYQFTHRRVLPYSRPTGRRLYFFKDDLNEFVQRNYHKSKSQIASEV